MVSERIALVAETGTSLVRLRAELLLELAIRRHRVLCITGPIPGKEMRILRELGAQHRALSFEAAPIELLSDWRLVSGLKEIFEDWQPNIVLGYGARAMPCAAIAASRSNVRRIVSVVSEGLPPAKTLSLAARRLSYALKASHAVVFHNHDAERTLTANGTLPPGIERLTVPGAGVDLRRYKPTDLPPLDGGMVFLMLARLDQRHGVLDYALAARALKATAPTARCLLAGPPGSGRGAVAGDLVAKASNGAVEVLGDLDDVRDALAGCHVFVYPSHSEGMPRAVLEALASGRPVITTRTPGCRETIDEKVSGSLVDAGNAEALRACMMSYIATADLLPSLARAARLKAERRFSADDVNSRLIALLGL